jgi:hypothetical protein
VAMGKKIKKIFPGWSLKRKCIMLKILSQREIGGKESKPDFLL